MSTFELNQFIQETAKNLGFSKIGIAPAKPDSKMDLLTDGSHSYESKTTIYGIYKGLELQAKFGLDVIEI